MRQKSIKPFKKYLNELSKENMKLPKPNESTTDRLIRAVAGLVLLTLGYYWLSSYLQIVAYVAAAALLMTAALGYCHLYTLMGWDTAKSKK